MDTDGTHIIADLWFDKPLVDNWADLISDALLGPGKMAILRITHYNFEPQGESWVWLLAESHCSAHTYPEHNYLALDIYGCGKGEPVVAYYAIEEALQPVHKQFQVLARGIDARPQANAA